METSHPYPIDIMKAKSWKQVVRVADLSDNQKLDATCKTCGHVHYLTKALICVSEERDFCSLTRLNGKPCAGRVVAVAMCGLPWCGLTR